jgi:hypothetical protein
MTNMTVCISLCVYAHLLVSLFCRRINSGRVTPLELWSTEGLILSRLCDSISRLPQARQHRSPPTNGCFSLSSKNITFCARTERLSPLPNRGSKACFTHTHQKHLPVFCFLFLFLHLFRKSVTPATLQQPKMLNIWSMVLGTRPACILPRRFLTHTYRRKSKKRLRMPKARPLEARGRR